MLGLTAIFKEVAILASIVKRKNRYSVVYTYTDENGGKRQKWETFATNAEAKKRKKQIEFEQDTLIPYADQHPYCIRKNNKARTGSHYLHESARFWLPGL